MTNSYKKEYPFVGYAGFGGGVGALSAKSAASKPYVDDVFSPYVWTGTGSSRDISNGIDLSGKGGMVWIKKRDGGSIDQNNVLFDTERDIGGVPAYLASNTDEGQDASATLFSAFNSDGFTVGSSDITNGSYSTPTYGSWSFRKQKGFFDVVTYTGNGSVRTISHSLDSVPGCIMVKKTSGSAGWYVYHRSLGATKYLGLNGTFAEQPVAAVWNNTEPTSTHFTVGTDGDVNGNGAEFVAYLFAGGESTTDNAVDFDGSGDYLSIADNAAWDIGTNYTAECWFNIDALTGAGWDAIFGQWPGNNNDSQNTWTLEYVGTTLYFYYNDASTVVQNKSLGTVSLGEWHHFAFSKEGSNTRLFIDGELKHTFTISLNAGNGTFNIGGNVASGGYINGKVSNVRITKDQALYTSDFIPSKDPLTQTSQGAISSNVKLLCCNQSTVTGSTVTPATITANGDTSAVTNASIFDDSSAYIFGEDEDQGIVKAGVYTGNGQGLGPNIDLGWEPQYLLIKNTDLGSENWHILDNIRGIIATDTGDGVLSANTNGLELTQNLANLTSTGFTPTTSDDKTNGDGHTYIYLAIRRPDGYVGKPATVGTDVFAMDTGNASPDIPTFDSGFPVDFAMMRNPGSADPNFIGARLTGKEGNRFNASPPEASTDFGAQWAWGSNVGWCANSNYSTGTQSWMWKRGQGFDVVTWIGDGVAGRSISHSLNAVPKMMIVKTRTDGSIGYAVYHVGLNGGSNPEQYYLQMPGNDNAVNSSTRWNDTAPTSTNFTVGNSSRVNLNNSNYLALLFGDVTGISKCGYYTGDGTSDGSHSIDVGFQPRFIIIKQNNGTNWKNYVVIDTLRGEDNIMYLNASDAQSSSDLLDISSTGWSFKSSDELVNSNENSNRYVYYAHA